MEGFKFNVCIVGLGLIGSSYARALRKINVDKIIAIDINEDVLKNAKGKNIIDEGFIDPKVALKDADIVILAVYPELTEKFVIDNMKYFKTGAIITDSAGIKSSIINNINKNIRSDVDFIGGHPMAGKEGSGFENGSETIFNGANYLITPTEINKENNIKIIEDMARKIGCKNIVRIDPSEHDRIIAYTSHLPHILAVALINSDILNKDTSLFVAGSFRDATRVADINAGLWTELIMQNKDHVIEQLSIFEENISKIKSAIEKEDNLSVYSQLEEAGEKKRRIRIYV